ncbi:MAG: hypothetical protein WBP79_10290, partial [Candidatus Acidiferrales bacterium]
MAGIPLYQELVTWLSCPSSRIHLPNAPEGVGASAPTLARRHEAAFAQGHPQHAFRPGPHPNLSSLYPISAPLDTYPPSPFLLASFEDLPTADRKDVELGRMFEQKNSQTEYEVRAIELRDSNRQHGRLEMSPNDCKQRTSFFLIVTRTGPFFARNLTQIFALCAISLLFLSSFSAAGIGSTRAYPDPEDGAVKSGAYSNDYFGLRYALPAGWSDDLKGPPPSVSGFYSLVALKPEGELTATMLFAAQDMFFSSPPIKGEMDFLIQMEQHLDPSLTASAAPVAVEIAGHSFARLDYHGDALYYSVFATEIRCHILIFSLTSRSPEKVQALAASLSRISFAPNDQTARWPVCVRDYATAEHIVHRVNPELAGPRFAS